MTCAITELCACAVCNGLNVCDNLVSTSFFGTFDLDFRPPPPDRNALRFYIQCCSHCGYASPVISENPLLVSKADLDFKPYQDILLSHYPEKATHFLAFAFLLERKNLFEPAAQEILKAAWICDDLSLKEFSLNLRVLALEKLSLEGSLNYRQSLLMIDLLRRVGRTPEAKALLKDCLPLSPTSEIEKDIINRQKALLLP